ncbi:MAG: hypothetical protein SFU98_10175 [Leptospiraceae bacterium]|nr:hypothetical protein [Leptospiraceae bacterium]
MKLILLLLLNCATLLTPRTTSVSIKPEDEKQFYKIFCEDEFIIETNSPKIIILPSNKICEIKFQSSNGEALILQIPKIVNLAIIGNCHVFGILFLPIDFVTGYYKIHDKEPIIIPKN